MSPSTSSPAGWKRGQSRPELRSRGERGAEHLPGPAEAQPDTGQTRPGERGWGQTLRAALPRLSRPGDRDNPRSRPLGLHPAPVPLLPPPVPGTARPIGRRSGFRGDASPEPSPRRPSRGFPWRCRIQPGTARAGDAAEGPERDPRPAPGPLRAGGARGPPGLCLCCSHRSSQRGQRGDSGTCGSERPAGALSPPRAGPPRSGCAVTSRVPKGRQVSLCLYPAPGEERRGGNPRVPR